MRTKLRAKVIWSRRRRRWLDWDWIWSSTREGPPTAHMGAREPKRGLASEQKCSRPSNCVPAVAVCDLHTDSHRQKGILRKCQSSLPWSILFGPCASRRRRFRALTKDEHCSYIQLKATGAKQPPAPPLWWNVPSAFFNHHHCCRRFHPHHQQHL